MSFLFRSYAQIAQDVRQWSRRLPADIVAVCGIPRSGTIIAAMFAEFRHIHYVELADLQRGLTPWTRPHRRKVPAKAASGRVLVIDDTCWTGRTIKQTRKALSSVPNAVYGALYFGDEGRPHLDYGGRRLATFQHTFEYNMLRDCLTKDALFDMDGVLCDDWGQPDCGPDWEPCYREFVESARPLYLPCYPIAGIVTARMARHRDATERWLQRHGVQYGQLCMASFTDERERQRFGHARYKAEVYGNHADSHLFVESHDSQAREIHARTGKPVLSVETMTMYGGVDPDPWRDDVAPVSSGEAPPMLELASGGPASGRPIAGPLQVVISHYDARTPDHLYQLLDDLRDTEAGWPYRLRVVVNQTDPGAEFRLPERFADVEVRTRPNTGFNIGAWDFGWRASNEAEAVLFLQDDCQAIRDDWAKRFVDKLNEPGTGLVGESLNPRWDLPWADLAARYKGRRDSDHQIDGRQVDRISCYQRCLKDWGVEPGAKGDHLQALVLAARRSVLEAIDGFEIGANKGEAIAAEIAASKKVQQRGLQITEVGPRPFWCFSHPDWN